ncbi:hypothetical protein BO94DRAFT_593235 [Aspergillus sclerotioniger CBS 115572]|uniref:NAD dependent epimerase/dehydratase n=1 Tax=Aspergillus sclerotioniger CBS 115572 TaxID=1450535 RepID=A0A317WVP3_9EURO|nr:hypothetical protein BO94DRAFT_593235 [Aspergillus sclerotioniger CBS 115572]PWY90413.1 hypothetical protein BO94DRAFT_593235 [Aspergillus sclerotioniger CBS 115572]
MGQTPSTPKPGTKLQVIGAGLSRTGTASFSAALSILLHGPVYHGGTQTTIGPPTEITTWITILKHLHTSTPSSRHQALTLMAHLLTGYVAITDCPGAQLIPELLDLYPDAKVICTVRDPIAWAKSMTRVRDLVRGKRFLRAVFLPLPGMRHFVEYVGLMRVQWQRVYGGSGGLGGTYERHVEWLREIVPEERLVFVDVRDGWEPICRALGREVPCGVPFPRVNDAEAIRGLARWHVWRGLVRWVGVLVVVVLVTWG